MEIKNTTIKGSTKSIILDDDALTISYRTLYHGFKGDKRIPFSSITAVQFREPGSWVSGYIQFSMQGSIEWQGPVSQDENAIQFDSPEADYFLAVRDYVLSKIGEPVRRNLLSVADEVEKLANLLDRGLLTQDEFTTQKTRLLKP